MAIVIPEVTARVGAAQSSSDVFLHVQTRRAGKIKGESTLGGHEEDILLTSWNWGLSAASAIGSTQATGRRSYTALTVQKTIDQATTALMSALATNDPVKEARLTMRRAGGDQASLGVGGQEGIEANQGPSPTVPSWPRARPGSAR